MNVRLLETRVSNGHLMYEGEVVDLPTDEAWRLLKAGQAEEPEPRTAMVSPDRAAVLARPKPTKSIRERI